MNYSVNDILLASANREIVVWRRMGGTNPGYGLDVDGKTAQFVGRGLTALKAVANGLAKDRGLKLSRPATTPIPIAGSGATATHTDTETSAMLGRFYSDDTEYAWGERMEPQGE
ncbi:hypothetical protein K2Z83_15680 [Oscillochloris sp. ZM17-4]|uniref:hypothetical protein n=1 Tax=Oscillochloris sp. ZM17-4 TaxID=2866714 RepID=UPI001C73CB47|nr:hypothetical protein [Oscillochloris sp. ZM17-4]MBX0329118.1 hypothetical protein [Oscillochloris sp. ZM17-4]